MRRLLSAKVFLGALALLLSVGATVAQDCPCWTAEQLASVPVDRFGRLMMTNSSGEAIEPFS